jgi:hypothetical protein
LQSCVKIKKGAFMKGKFVYILLIVLVLVLGCASPPTEEMDSAREAVFRAENDADTVQYAAGTLGRARSALGRMQEAADSKRFDDAKTYAIEAQNLAERAMMEGRTGADRARMESAPLVAGLRAEIEETSSNVSSARYSLLDLDYDALDRAIFNAHNVADRAEFSQAQGRYQDAIDSVRDVRTELTNINQLIASAAVAVKK